VTLLPLAAVEDVRARIARAHARAAAEFRDLFVLGETDPTRHLELLATALIDEARGVRLHGPAYTIDGNVITPIYENFEVEPDALFEYWMIASEIAGSASWRMTRVIATAEEYDEVLRRMQSPQIVRALVGSFLPSIERSTLEVTVYTRAGEERVERRMLVLDESNELDFHSRELIAEGRGGVPV
jgi:hypothetical protein